MSSTRDVRQARRKEYIVLSTQELSSTPFQYKTSFDWVIETRPSFCDVRFSNKGIDRQNVRSALLLVHTCGNTYEKNVFDK
jgi:hypothetical protein